MNGYSKCKKCGRVVYVKEGMYFCGTCGTRSEINEMRDSMVDVKIKLIEGGRMPEYKRDGDVCLDCYAMCTEKITVTQCERVKIPLGFALELPECWEAVIRPRSGMNLEGVDVKIGTIDTNYRGECCAVLENNSGKIVEVNNGDRICQLAIREAPKVKFVVVDELSETKRGDKGFGSSGK